MVTVFTHKPIKIHTQLYVHCCTEMMVWAIPGGSLDFDRLHVSYVEAVWFSPSRGFAVCM